MKKNKAVLKSQLFMLETELSNIVMKYGINSDQYYKKKSEVNPQIAAISIELEQIELKEEQNKWIP